MGGLNLLPPPHTHTFAKLSENFLPPCRTCSMRNLAFRVSSPGAVFLSLNYKLARCLPGTPRRFSLDTNQDLLARATKSSLFPATREVELQILRGSLNHLIAREPENRRIGREPQRSSTPPLHDGQEHHPQDRSDSSFKPLQSLEGAFNDQGPVAEHFLISNPFIGNVP